jgi:hypothetical protein
MRNAGFTYFNLQTDFRKDFSKNRPRIFLKTAQGYLTKNKFQRYIPKPIEKILFEGRVAARK